MGTIADMFRREGREAILKEKEQWIASAKQEGRQEGRQEGKVENAQEMLIRSLRLRDKPEDVNHISLLSLFPELNDAGALNCIGANNLKGGKSHEWRVECID